MSGFTPINADAVNQKTTMTNHAQDGGETTTSKGKRRKPARKKSSPEDSSQLHSQAPKHAGRVRIYGPGEKRQISCSESFSFKKRKHRIVISSLPSTKSGRQSDIDVKRSERPSTLTDDLASVSTYTGGLSSPSKAKLDGWRYHANQELTGDANDSQQGHSMSVYAPQTSMSFMQSQQPQTTMQAVHSSTGGSSLLYSSNPDFSTRNTTVELTRPLLISAPVPRADEPSITTIPHPKLQMRTPVNSDSPTKSADRALRANNDGVSRKDSSDYGEPLERIDHELIELTKRVESKLDPERKLPSRERRLNIRDVDENEDYGGALLTEEERKLLASLKTPKDQRKPIVRTSFPSPILDRTSLFGVSNTTALRTCFRVGEALNTGCQAVRTGWNVVLEIYARITSSWREPKPSRKQHFVINDLYHDRPPFINGTFELWNENALWEKDSRPFLDASGDGMMCRMVAKMKRDGTKWRLEILSIWQADWDDIEHAAGIFTKASL